MAETDLAAEKEMKKSGDLEERIAFLERELNMTEVKKNEAINKLAQVMFSRSPTREGSNQSSSSSRRQEREIRKLRGELQHETVKFQNMVEKYQKAFEDTSSKVAEELELRQDLQVKLLQSEQQIASLKSSLSNRPSMEVTDFPPQIDITPIVDRETCHVLIPKGHNSRKQGWRDAFMVLSLMMKQLAIYDNEEALQTHGPIMTFQFGQIYRVRCLKPGEHEILRVKQSDVKMILMLSYIEDLTSSSSDTTHEEPKLVRGHQFVEIHCHTPSNYCDVCNKTLAWSLNIVRKGECSYECQRCHLKCHKEHVSTSEGMQPCVGGPIEQNIKRQLLLIKDCDELERWYRKLSRITLISNSAAHLPLLRTAGNMRLPGRRPGAATVGRSQSIPVSRLRTRDSGSSDGSGDSSSKPHTYYSPKPD